MNKLDVLYERACMATTRYENHTKMFENLFDHKYCHNTPLSSEKLRQAVGIVVIETEEEERDAERNANEVTMDTFFNHYTISPSKGDICKRDKGSFHHFTIRRRDSKHDKYPLHHFTINKERRNCDK